MSQLILPRRRLLTSGASLVGMGAMPAYAQVSPCSPASESPNATLITAPNTFISASPTPGTPGTGNLITFNSGGQIVVNGTTIGGASVVALYYIGHTAYQKNGSGQWYGPITAGAGNIGTGTVDPTLPAALVSNSLTSWAPVFLDDFTNAATIATTTGAANGFNWYFPSAINTTGDFSVMTAATAGSISNGNPNGGLKPSTGGGIIQITNDAYANATLQTCSQTNLTTGGAAAGSWHSPCYIECYMQYNATPVNGSGWPAFWTWGATAGYPVAEVDIMEAFGTIGGTTYNFEQGATHNWTSSSAQSPAQSIPYTGLALTSNWQTVGLLWLSTGATSGTIQCFINDAAVSSVVVTGSTAGSPIPAMESTYRYIIIGTAGWTAYWDWVRVWQPLSA